MDHYQTGPRPLRVRPPRWYDSALYPSVLDTRHRRFSLSVPPGKFAGGIGGGAGAASTSGRGRGCLAARAVANEGFGKLTNTAKFDWVQFMLMSMCFRSICGGASLPPPQPGRGAGGTAESNRKLSNRK